jgi:hypothetical protein
MKVINDLIAGGGEIAPIDLWYNGDLAVDSVTKRYKGSLVKMMDVDDIDHGKFFTFAGVATVLENIAGILEEEQGITGNYLPDDGTYSVGYRKISPIFPSSIIEAEYAQKDAAGTANNDDTATGSAGSATFTVTITTADTLIGGWIYFLTGANAGYLHYVTDNGTTTATLSPVLNYAVAAGDKYLVINPPCTNLLLFDATYTGLKSEIDNNARTATVCGLTTWIDAPVVAKTKLDFAKHAGLKVTGAKFYHQFTIPGNSTIPSFWYSGIKAS